MTGQLVADVMTSPVLTVSATDPTSDVARAMAREDIKSVVVITEDCSVEGIFTATDYMELGVAASHPESTTIGDCMTTSVVTVSPSDSVTAAADQMVDHDISHLPVVGSDDQVTGIVSSTDLTVCLAP
ncbi:CBS domain-containing protein [Haloarcula salinisoli]|uniref:CBS domain-containing protein n=1 Tax=Haloarcula salinisoli TaxID=2487746 RepID=A0A8J7YQD3_9EURY|nr:CBS domain-containing protein [Halomicroarcula salinisoli]MBX0288301.1 CBS domain-containing protein [Halomicroarcula salinisoli]MBX0305961.1 CBS domain-containing protein [Halomicroarcula salinisoli]